MKRFSHFVSDTLVMTRRNLTMLVRVPQLLVFSLYQQFKAEGESFKPKYLKILSAGGSEAPEQILSDAGIDIRSAKFWQGGFDVLSKMVDELEKL